MPPAREGPLAPFKLGDFVVSNFPYDETPAKPGPAEHLALCLGTFSATGGRVAMVAAYTSSQPWPADIALPLGVRLVTEAAARRMGQRRAFRVDARRIAFLPITEEFFPRLRQSDRGKVGESVALARAVIDDLKKLSQTPGLIVQVGPLRPS
jgi:hypothetical protein